MAKRLFNQRPANGISDEAAAQFTSWLLHKGKPILTAQQNLAVDLVASWVVEIAAQANVGAPIALMTQNKNQRYYQISPTHEGHVCASLQQWVLAKRCTDLVILHHVLDFSVDPYTILQQAVESLHVDGKLIVVGFQPFSLWHLTSYLHRQDQQWLAAMRLNSAQKVSAWLAGMDCSTDAIIYDCYDTFESKHQGIVHKLGQRLWRNRGAFYVLVASKKTAMMKTLTPPSTVNPTPQTVGVTLVGKTADRSAAKKALKHKLR